MVFDPDYLLLFARVILWWAETCANILSALSRRAIRSGRDFRVLGPLAGHKSETYIWFRAKILRNDISVIFLQKGV